MAQHREPISSVLPPLIFGTATFNSQYNKDPFALNTTGLVQEALDLGVRAFDTSPYYGPSEDLLGKALDTSYVRQNYPREQYFILTKAGRIASEEFDYSAEAVGRSVKRSLERLRTPYLDVVYCHDVEFVSAEEVLEAVRELRRLRDAGVIRYVGISGYPVDVLCSLAERIRDETGEPLDIVMSYGNYNLQNTALAQSGMARLAAAGVDVVPNASILDMGLLRHDGVPVGSEGDWHPSPQGLRAAVKHASDLCDEYQERLEVIAIRWALESWIEVGERVGSLGDDASGVSWTRGCSDRIAGKRLGVSVMGVSHSVELHKTMGVWRSILDGLENGAETAAKAGRWTKAHEWSLNRKQGVLLLADGVRERLGPWLDHAWESPAPGFVNKHKKTALKARSGAPWPTPEGTPEPSGPPESHVERSIPLR